MLDSAHALHVRAVVVGSGFSGLAASIGLAERGVDHVLAQLHDATDPEGGGSYTVKRYHSEKAADDIGSWTEPLGMASLFVEGTLAGLSLMILQERAGLFTSRLRELRTLVPA